MRRSPPRISVAASAKGSEAALLSVVMPVYDIEEFLGAAIDSVLSQSYANFELILVDDGSNDRSGDICDACAVEDPRIVVIHQANGGLGNARNSGARAARGEYIAFIDSDDLLPPDAYERLISSLRASGSDFATGNVERFDETRKWRAWNQAVSHLRDVKRTSMTATPELLYDTQAWNKVFTKSFYDRTGVCWVEGKLYEDMVPMLKAYLDATAVDVLTAVTYRWRNRAKGTSITQSRNELKNLVDKIEMIEVGQQLLLANDREDLLDLFYLKVFDGDLFAYQAHLFTGDDQFDLAFEAAVRQFWPHDRPGSLDHMWLERRLLYETTVSYGLEQAQLVWNWAMENRFRLPTVIRDEMMVVDTTRLGEDLPDLPDLPDRVWRLVRESQINTTTTDMRWVDGRLRIEGWAYIPNDEKLGEQVITVEAVGRNGLRIDCDITKVPSPHATRYAASSIRTHEDTGFQAWLDPADLAAVVEPGRSLTFELEVSVSRVGLRRVTPMIRMWRGGAVLGLTARSLPDGRNLQIIDEPGQPFSVRITPVHARATQVSLVERQLSVTCELAPGTVAVKAWLKHDRSKSHFSMTVEPGPEGEVTLVGELPEPQWRGWVTRVLMLQMDDGRQTHVALDEELTPSTSGDNHALRIVRSRAGRLTVIDGPRLVEVDDIDILPDKFIRLSGSGPPGVNLEFGFGSLANGPEVWTSARHRGGNFEVNLDVTSVDQAGRRRPLKDDTYVIKVRNSVPQWPASEEKKWFLRTTLACAVRAPVRSEQPDVSLQVNLTKWRELRFWSQPPISHDERSRYWQTRFAEESRRFGVSEQPEDAVFFTTYFGFEASDSPRAIHDELVRRKTDMTLYWGVVDHSVDVPEGAVPVIKNTKEWYRVIAASRYLVNNVAAVYAGYERLPHQIDVQTWHGTPLKIVGRSLLELQGRSTAELEVEGEQWSYLISQSPFYSDVVAREFATDAKIVEVGYPRNDELFRTTESDVAGIKNRLGIPHGLKVILYAPTWRDNVKSGWSAKFFEGLDLQRLTAHLGFDWIVLMRGHGYNARTNGPSRTGGRVVDVTDHPSINDLYRVSDALITDYSSVMFDYSVTGKPMYFYAPDYEQYVTMRPTYFDLKQEAPGPVLFEQDELHDALDRFGSYSEEFGQTYEKFAAKFAPWDDGNSASRVVDEIFGKEVER